MNSKELNNMKKRSMDDENDDPSCRVCKKTFKSMKSLYGHMRCHQRNWRGVSPPPNAADFSDSNQALPPKNWSITAKRGRKAGKSSTTPSSPNDPILTDAVTNLLLLANQQSKAEKPEKKSELRRHQCVTCSKIFNSHQALGGHRSSHKKVIVNEDRKVRKLLDFDLNEPPKEEDE